MAGRTPPPWWQHEAAIAWSLLLLPPLGLVLMWKYGRWRNRFRWTWTIVMPMVWLFVVAGILAAAPQADDQGAIAEARPTATAPVKTSTTRPQLTQTVASTAAATSQATAVPSTIVTATATPEPLTAAAEEEAREADTTNPSLSAGDVSVPELASSTGRLDVYFFNVSLGDAIYIRTPRGLDVIIDGGDSPNELSAFLDQFGETAFDLLIASHPHADHIRGLPRVIRERQVGTVWTNGQTYSTQIYSELEAAIASNSTKRVAGPGDAFDLDGVSFKVLAPSRIGSNINDNSLVVRMDCGPSSFLFTGDAEEGSESDMILAGYDLDVDILKLGHHGSRTSTSSQMILSTTPRLAIYSAMPGNQYGHPHQETLDRLARANVPVFGTGAAGGTVVVSTACDDQFAVSPQFADFPTANLAHQPPVVAPSLPSPAPTLTLVLPTDIPSTTVPNQGDNCDPSYPMVCIPLYPPDLDCGEITFRRFTVLPPDPHGFDGNDNDGIGCET